MTATDVVTPDQFLDARELSRTYRISRRPRPAVDGVSLQVRQGEFVAVMGPSGCGKSTLLNLLGGLDQPDHGRVVIAGNDLSRMSDRDLAHYRRDHIGVVFQSFNLVSSLTAAENVALPLRLRGRAAPSPSAVRERVTTLMDAMNLHGLQGHSPEETSGGEQQRVAIARALAAAPELLLADEPTGNLDWTTSHEVMGTLDRYCRREGVTVVLVTHDARMAAYADRVLIMRDGAITDEAAMPAREPGDEPDPRPLIERLAAVRL
jgi:putative ABC transport system ATP-binding protein